MNILKKDGFETRFQASVFYFKKCWHFLLRIVVYIWHYPSIMGELPIYKTIIVLNFITQNTTSQVLVTFHLVRCLYSILTWDLKWKKKYLGTTVKFVNDNVIRFRLVLNFWNLASIHPAEGCTRTHYTFAIRPNVL